MRSIEENARHLVVKAYPELAEALKSYSTRMAWRRKNRGEQVDPGELKGHSYVMGRMMCWFLTLNEADRARIQEEGQKLMDRLHELPADYEGPLPFGPRTESALIRDAEVDTIVPARRDFGQSAADLDESGNRPRRGRRAPDGGQKSKRTG